MPHIAKIPMACIAKRFISISCPIFSHDNPLGLPMPRSLPKDGPTLRDKIARGLPKKQKIPNVDRVITVASGKGGVGKSTVSVNLALSLSRLGLRVGLLDADIFGPSIPKMMNLKGLVEVDDSGLMLPLVNYGLSTMSMGYLVNESDAIVWRGLMVMKALEQLLFQVNWSPGIDVLVIDMPPGTGDTQLTISQTVDLAGSVIISTPQEVALSDVRKGIQMFEKVSVPILGLIQNMAYFKCPGCSQKSFIFGEDGCRNLASSLKIDIIGDIPLVPSICSKSDLGTPIIVSEPNHEISLAFLEIAKILKQKLVK